MIPATDGAIENYEGTGIVIADRLGTSSIEVPFIFKAYWAALFYARRKGVYI